MNGKEQTLAAFSTLVLLVSELCRLCLLLLPIAKNRNKGQASNIREITALALN